MNREELIRRFIDKHRRGVSQAHRVLILETDMEVQITNPCPYCDRQNPVGERCEGCGAPPRGFGPMMIHVGDRPPLTGDVH